MCGLFENRILPLVKRRKGGEAWGEKCAILTSLEQTATLITVCSWNAGDNKFARATVPRSLSATYRYCCFQSRVEMEHVFPPFLSKLRQQVARDKLDAIAELKCENFFPTLCSCCYLPKRDAKGFCMTEKTQRTIIILWLLFMARFTT